MTKRKTTAGHCLIIPEKSRNPRHLTSGTAFRPVIPAQCLTYFRKHPAMKYLIITNHSYMLWQFRRELITELLARGEVVVSTPFVGREKELSGIGCRLIKTEVDRRGANPAKDYALFRKYRRIIGAEKPDAVIHIPSSRISTAGSPPHRREFPISSMSRGSARRSATDFLHRS